MGCAIIAGIDEAGRGALAGPVVAAACHVALERRGVHLVNAPRGFKLMLDGVESPLIADSKMLTAPEREQAFQFLLEHAPFGVGIVEAARVDALGILGATELAMQCAVTALQRRTKPTYLLIDGRDRFWFDLPHSSLVSGDVLEPCISAASILAKVIRDRIMVRSDGVFPGYGFAQHKGYGTAVHREMIRKRGLSPLHRQTFLSRLNSEPP